MQILTKLQLHQFLQQYATAYYNAAESGMSDRVKYEQEMRAVQRQLELALNMRAE